MFTEPSPSACVLSWLNHLQCPPFTLGDTDQITSLVAQMVKNLPTMRETQARFPGLGRSPGEGNGNPLQHSCLENPMDGEAWRATQSRAGSQRVGHDFTSLVPTLILLDLTFDPPL